MRKSFKGKFTDDLYNLTYIRQLVINYFNCHCHKILFLISQSIGKPNASTIIMKSLGFYLVMNFEVFMFCFAGEYLSAKVSVNIYGVANY